MSITSSNLPAENSSHIDEEEKPYEQSVIGSERDISELEIDVKEDPFQVSAIVQKIDRKQLVLAPDYQRNEVWGTKRRSEFIESILLNYPLPPLFLNQDREGRYIVVDGLQRSSSIYRYMKNEFALSGLKQLFWLNGLTFNELSPSLQTRIEDRKLLCFVLKPTVPMSTVYDIFARINRGGMQLTRQEIRHALHQGKATALLKRLAGSLPFHEWLGCCLQPNRMRDEEAVLRCIAFARTEPEQHYRGDMDEFLNEAMRALNRSSDTEIAAIEAAFVPAMAQARTLFGEDAFRIPTVYTRGRINLAVMETIYRFLVVHEDAWLQRNAKTLLANYQRLLETSEYLDAVRSSTGDTNRVRQRFHLAHRILEEGCAD